MKVEESALTLLAVASFAGTGEAGVLASMAVGAASAGTQDAPPSCWTFSPAGRVLGGESSSSGQLGSCDCRVDALSNSHRRQVYGRRNRRWENRQGATINTMCTTEAGLRRRSATGVRGGAVVSDPYNARMQVMITRNMRKVLVEELGYLTDEVDDMDPQIAAVVIEKSLPRPRAGMPIAWRRSIRQRKTSGPFFLRPVRLLAVAVETAAGAVVNGAVTVVLFPFVAVGKGFGAVRSGGAKGAAAAVVGLGVAAVLAVLVMSSLSENGGADGVFPGSARLRPLAETLSAAKARLPALKGKSSDNVGGSTAAPPGARGGGGDGISASGVGGGASAGAKWAGSVRRGRGKAGRSKPDGEEKQEEGLEGLEGNSGLKKKNGASSKKNPRSFGRTQQHHRRDDGGASDGEPNRERVLTKKSNRANSSNSSKKKSKRRAGESMAGQGEEALAAAGDLGSISRSSDENEARRFDDLPPTPPASHETSLIDDVEGEESWEESPDPSHRWGRAPMDEHIPSEEEMEAWEDTIQEEDTWLDRRISIIMGSLFGRGGGGKDDKAPPR